MLLCREHHKVVDDNEEHYPVIRLQQIRRDYLAWLAGQLATSEPWQISVSAFTYLNYPRLVEFASLNGHRIQHPELPSDQPLHDLGFNLIKLMSACKATLENIEIDSIGIEKIDFAHEGYVGSLISFDRLRFRTRNVPAPHQAECGHFAFTGDLEIDPHIYRKFKTWKLVINIDPQWITTSTAYTMFRPSAGHTLFTGFARLTNIDLELGQITATGLAIGVPKPEFDIFEPVKPDVSPIDFIALEDDVTKSLGGQWHGKLDCCDICGKTFDNELYMVDGPNVPGGPWGNLCAACYSKSRLPLGIGMGQLYRRDGVIWRLVGGYPQRQNAEEELDSESF